MKYVALLRGANVGTSGRIDMRQLKTAFEAAGMTSFRTYINSGNVVFATDMADRARITQVLEGAISERFGFPGRLLVRDVDQMRSLIEALPDDWANNESAKCDVFFLWEEVDGPAILDRLDFDPAMEDVRYSTSR